MIKGSAFGEDLVLKILQKMYFIKYCTLLSLNKTFYLSSFFLKLTVTA